MKNRLAAFFMQKKENYSRRQLERQLDSGYYERNMLSKDVLLPISYS